MKPTPPTDLQRTLDRIRPIDQAVLAEVQARLNRQTKPKGSLGRLEEFARQSALADHGAEGSYRDVLARMGYDDRLAELVPVFRVAALL